MHDPILTITLPALLLALITGVAVNRRHFHPNLWLLAASAVLAASALIGAARHSDLFGAWMALSA